MQRHQYEAADHISWQEWLALVAILAAPVVLVIVVVRRWL